MDQLCPKKGVQRWIRLLLENWIREKNLTIEAHFKKITIGSRDINRYTTLTIYIYGWWFQTMEFYVPFHKKKECHPSQLTFTHSGTGPPERS